MTPEQVRQIARLYLAGHSYAQIGYVLDMEPGDVARRVSELDLGDEKAQRPWPDEARALAVLLPHVGYPPPKAAMMLGRTEDAVKHARMDVTTFVPPNFGRKELLRMLAEISTGSHDIESAADAYGVPVSFVYAATILGEPRKRRKPPRPTKRVYADGKRYWTEDEKEAARRMRAEGKTIQEIAELLDRPHGSVAGFLSRDPHVVRLRKKREWTPEEAAKLRRMAEEGKTVKEIAHALHRSHASVYGFARRTFPDLDLDHRRSWTDEEVDALIEGVRAGERVGDLAIRLNKTMPACYTMICRLRAAGRLPPVPRKDTAEDRPPDADVQPTVDSERTDGEHLPATPSADRDHEARERPTSG